MHHTPLRKYELTTYAIIRRLPLPHRLNTKLVLPLHHLTPPIHLIRKKQATKHGYTLAELSVRFYDRPRPHTTCVLGHKNQSLHLQCVDGREWYKEVMEPMARCGWCGWYRQAGW